MKSITESPPQPRSAASVEERRINADVADRLQRYSGSAALAEGQLNLMSLDPIAARLGSKWAGKRESIYDYTERTLEKHIGARGSFLRVSETDFLVVLPEDARLTAQVRCLRFLRAIQTHFLGEARLSDLTVHAVSRILPGGLEAILVDPIQTLAREQGRLAEAENKKPPGLVDRWTPFVASNGKIVRVSCVFEPVYELKHYRRIGNRIARRVLCVRTEQELSPAEIQNLSRAEIERIDLATIARALDRLRVESADQD